MHKSSAFFLLSNQRIHWSSHIAIISTWFYKYWPRGNQIITSCCDSCGRYKVYWQTIKWLQRKYLLCGVSLEWEIFMACHYFWYYQKVTRSKVTRYCIRKAFYRVHHIVLSLIYSLFQCLGAFCYLMIMALICYHESLSDKFVAGLKLFIEIAFFVYHTQRNVVSNFFKTQFGVAWLFTKHNGNRRQENQTLKSLRPGEAA